MRVEGAVLERALDTLDDVIYIYDETARLVYWNQRLNELYGLTDAELEGMHATEFFGPSEQPAIEAALDEIRETGETVVEAVSPTVVEGPIRFELTGRLLTDDDGDIVGFAGIGRDVTDRYEQAGQLSRHNERLDEFADLLAHDLRNPLSVASGHLALARDGDDRASLDAIEAAHDRIERIITDIRVATREGTLVADVEPVDVARVARAAWEYVDTVGAVFEGPDELRLEADADRLLRLFENLFRNAVEHGSTGNRTQSDDAVEHGSTSPDSGARQDAVEHGSTGNRTGSDDAVEHGSTSPDSGTRQDAVEHGSTSNRTQSDDPVEHGRVGEGTPVTVRLDATAEGFAVADDGPGVDPAVRDSVFDPGVSDTATGTGFGLYIVWTIADAHGWDVTVTEAAGGGARFEFTC